MEVSMTPGLLQVDFRLNSGIVAMAIYGIQKIPFYFWFFASGEGPRMKATLALRQQLCIASSCLWPS
jgi:hypothetical protein